MYGVNRRKIEVALLNKAALGEKEQAKVLAEQKATKTNLGPLLVEKNLLSEEHVIGILAKLLGITRVDLFKERVTPEALDSIPAEIADRYRVFPVKIGPGGLLLAMADPLDLSAIDDVSRISGKEITVAIASKKEIEQAARHYYALRGYGLEVEVGSSVLREHGGQDSIIDDRGQGPVVQMVNTLIDRAVEQGASDIHLEPTGEGLRTRIRLDGILHDLAVPTRFRQEQIISRVKIMANLDIAEKRLAQDGNIRRENGSEEINLRVSTMPTIHGEKVVIRLLDKEKIILPLDKLGLNADSYRTFKRLLLNRSGMVLVTGPTGCGKTTTLYSALNYLNSSQVNIITVEDPVEYRLKGVNQVAVNRRIERTFAGALRTILRQDPDIIMVGEVRDLETVKIAGQAALTGHLVLSTLHTNSAAGAITRLTDMGLEPFMVTASTVGVIAQRLIRKVCPHCRAAYRPEEDEKKFYCAFFKKDPPGVFHRGKGCQNCNNTGYRGRVMIQEMLVLNRELQDMILGRKPAESLHGKAVEQGMVPLADDGLRCLEEGITTMGEVVRATFNSLYDSDICSYAESNSFFNRLYNK